MRRIGLVAAAALLAPAPAFATDAAARGAACAAVADAAERLACYDAVFRGGPVAAAPPASGPAPAAAPAAAAAAADPAATFGLENRYDPKRDAARLPEMSAKIVAVRTQGDGFQVATLDNGQRWAQTEKLSGVNWEVGETLVVRRGALGSFRAVVDGESWAVRVRRVD